MNTASEPQKNDNEISLLDIFVVLIRYRKMILCITFFALILAIAGYFINPVRQYNNALQNRKVQGRMFMSIRPIAQQYMPYNLAFIVNRPDIVMESLRGTGLETFEHRGRIISLSNKAEQARALHLINQFFVKNTDPGGRPYRSEDERAFQVIASNPFNIEVIFRNKNPEMVASFLNVFFAETDAIVADFLLPHAESMVMNYERLMIDPNITESMRQILEVNYEKYIFFRNILEGSESALMMIGNPIITEPGIFLHTFRSGYLRRGVIMVFTGIFFAVFLAFILNAINSIKHDKEAMKKINAALGKNSSK